MVTIFLCSKPVSGVYFHCATTSLADSGYQGINRRLKIFKILGNRYRNRRRRYGLRCNLLAAIYNYELTLSA